MYPGEYDKEKTLREVERKKLLLKKSKQKSSPGGSRRARATAELDEHSSHSEVDDLGGSQREGKEVCVWEGAASQCLLVNQTTYNSAVASDWRLC